MSDREPLRGSPHCKALQLESSDRCFVPLPGSIHCVRCATGEKCEPVNLMLGPGGVRQPFEGLASHPQGGKK